ncbi:MAG: phage portal protein [Candidatus Nanopelagicales bacterium]|nr:phage portal protein [Candidatus Nanopelagicales bacterium]
MAVRESLARLFGAKASIIGLSADELPDRALEKSYDDKALLSTYADDAWPYTLATIEATQATQAHLTIGRVKRSPEGEEERTPAGPDHPVQALFDNPNPQTTGEDLVYLWMLYLELAGHSPIEVVRPQGGGIIGAPGRAGRRQREGFELWAHNPSNWRVVADADGSIKGYLWLTWSVQDLKWRADQMTYLRWPNPNDRWYGQGRVQAIRQAVMAEEYASIRDKKFEKNLGVPPGILSSEMPLGEPTAIELQKRWEKAVGGYNNAGKIAILGSKTTYQPIQMSARDAQWLEQRQWRLTQMCGGFGVPMVLALGFRDATFANSGAARAELWEGTLTTKLNLIASMVTHRVLPLVTTEPLEAWFDYSKVEALGENEVEQADRAVKWANTGATTVDEVRAILKLPPMTDKRIGERMLIPSTLSLSAPDEVIANAELGMEGAQAAIDATRNPPPEEERRPPPRRSVKNQTTRGELLSPVIEGYKRDLSGYFSAQRGALNGAWKAMPQDEAETILQRAIEIITAKRWRERIARISRLPIETGLTLGASEAAATLGVSVSFSIPASEAALQAVTGHLDRLGVGIQNTTVDEVRAVLQDALRERLDNAGIRSRLDELFDGYQDWRLDRISRTEVTSAYNLGAIGQYRDVGVQTVKVSDGDVDAPCAAANGATWTLEEAEANPVSHPNCTRTWIPDTEGL